MLHLVLPRMVEGGRGRVINVSSDAARVGSSGEAVYAACKGGLVSLTKTLAREHARHGITCNVVCPGPTDTALSTGSGRERRIPRSWRRRSDAPSCLVGSVTGRPSWGDPLFASDDAAYVTGQVLSVSGGLTMVG